MVDDARIDELERIIQSDVGKRGVGFLHIPGELRRSCAALRPAGTVVLITGFPVVPPGSDSSGPVFSETDGPYGVAALARTLSSVGKSVRVVTDWPHEAGLVACLGAAFPHGPGRPELLVGPPAGDVAAWDSLVERALDGADHVVAIERAGPAADGTVRTMRAVDISRYCGPVHRVMTAATERGIGTSAVGDGGNELGMGRVADRTARHVVNGPQIACVVPADYTITAGVSNWGAYALCFALGGCRLGGSDARVGAALLPTEESELAVWNAGLRAGLVDGVTGRAELSVDGIPFRDHLAVLGRLAAAASGRQPLQ